MKAILFFTFGILPFALHAQQNFSINGNVKGLKAGEKLYLNYECGRKKIEDSAVVQNGKFNFSGQLEQPSIAVLTLESLLQARKEINDSPDLLLFWIEPGKLQVNGVDSIKNIKFTRSKINEDYQYLSKLSQKARPASAEKKKEVLAEIIAFIKKNPDSHLSAAVALSMIDPQQEKEAARSALSLLSPKLQNSSEAQRYRQQIETQALVGNLAPDFTQNDPSWNPVKLSDFRGKYVLLDF